MFSTTFLLCLLVAINTDRCGGQEFETTHGRVRGITVSVSGKLVDVFHGIPFAKPPVGRHRFKHPQAAEPWKPEIKDATTEKPACIQSTTIYDLRPSGFETRRLPNNTSEDCLYLSIWKPTSANPGSNKAVMVWIHGESYYNGGTSIPLYNGQYLAAENDVIVVSINYRLGPLGFAFLSRGSIPGNMGLMDQVEGLKWVKENVANFGGNQNKITLFGDNAGSNSIGYHLLSSFSRNLFNNAIMQSGVPISKLYKDQLNSKSEARQSVKKLSERIPCSKSTDAGIYACLMIAEPSAITRAFELVQTEATFFPVADGYFIRDDLMTMMERGAYKKTNIMTGVTKDEFSGYTAYYFSPYDRKVYGTGKEFGETDFATAITVLTQLRDEGRSMAVKTFYESEQSLPVDYVDIFNYATSDIVFKCPALLFSSFYTKSDSVFLYSLNYRVSTLQPLLPDWTGVPNSFDIDLVFGMPFNDSLGFNNQDKEMSRNMMKYWSNFAKTGNPNSPEPVTTNWKPFNTENQTYLALDVGSNLTARHGFRRHQCAFLNDILPMIPKDQGPGIPSTTWPDILCPRRSTGSGLCCECVPVVLGLLTASLWILKQ